MGPKQWRMAKSLYLSRLDHCPWCGTYGGRRDIRDVQSHYGSKTKSENTGYQHSVTDYHEIYVRHTCNVCGAMWDDKFRIVDAELIKEGSTVAEIAREARNPEHARRIPRSKAKFRRKIRSSDPVTSRMVRMTKRRFGHKPR